MTEPIKYKHIMDLGFTREDAHDVVFFNEHGYHPFWVYLDPCKKIQFFWCCEKKTVELRKMGKNGDILSRMPITCLAMLKTWIKFFKA